MKITIDKNIKEIPHYPKAAMYGLEDGWVRLASNENPFPPSSEVFSRINEIIPHITRYPGGEYELKESIAEKYGKKPEQIVLGNGSDELIEMALKTMKIKEKNSVIISDPSFAFYAIASKIYGYEIHRVPVDKSMKVDLSTILSAINNKTRVIFLNNPLNPTGTIFEEKAFSTFLKEIPPDILVVVDEAYAEFTESKKFPDSVAYTDNFPVLVLRTFSKAYALAGLRVGYGICDTSLASYLERTKQPFSINAIALNIAKIVLKDEEQLKKVLSNNRKGKRYFYRAFKELSIEYIPTEANYMLLRLGKRAEAITEDLFREKILVRWMGAYNLPEYIRVSVGKVEENIKFVEALKKML